MTNEMVEQGSATAIDIAVAGATGLLGEALLAVLEERNFPVSKLQLLGDEADIGKRLEFRGSYLKVIAVESFDFSTVRVLFLLDNPELALVGEQAAAAGCTVIDLSGHFRGLPGVPVVVPEVNGAYLAAGLAGQIIASPVGCVAPLARLLDALNRHGGISRLTITAMEPASWAGRAGVEELASQTASLLNARPITPELFAKQAAFNVLPQVGETMEDGYTREERAIVEDLQSLLDIPDLPISVTAVQVPAFFGFGVAVHLELANRLTAPEVVELLGELPGVEVMTEEYPTAVTEALEQDLVYVGRIREDLSYYGALAFWLVFDNVRNGAVLNGVQIAETMLKSYT
jgi:aspartate-semialdehyde dehydrogenase